MSSRARASFQSYIKDLDEKGERRYGGLDGPDSAYVRLVSNEGHVFVVKRRHAYLSHVLRSTLAVYFEKYQQNTVHFREPYMTSKVLEKLCTFFHFAAQNSSSNEIVPDFPIEVNICLDLLLAANHLDL